MSDYARLAVYAIVTADTVIEVGSLDPEFHRGRLISLFRDKVEYRPNTWTLPAGRVEKNESPLQAVSRELEQETGLIVELEDLELCGVMYRHPDFGSADAWVDLFYRVHKTSGRLVNNEPLLHSKLETLSVYEILDGTVKDFMPHQFAFLQAWASQPEGTTCYMEFNPRI